MNQHDLAVKIADETVQAVIDAVATRSPKFVPVYESRRVQLVAMIRDNATDREIIDNLAGPHKFASLRAWSQTNAEIATAYATIAVAITAEVEKTETGGQK